MPKFKHIIFLCLASGLTIEAKLKPKDIEGIWCIDTTSIDIPLKTKTRTSSSCVEYKIDSVDEHSAVGRSISHHKRNIDQTPSMKRHRLEKFNAQSQTYETESPAIFSVISMHDGTLIIKNQSLSRTNFSSVAFLDTDGSLKRLSSYQPRNQDPLSASVSTSIGKKKSVSIDADFDSRFHSLVSLLTPQNKLYQRK